LQKLESWNLVSCNYRCKRNQCPHNLYTIENIIIHTKNNKGWFYTQLLEQDFCIWSSNWNIAFKLPCKDAWKQNQLTLKQKMKPLKRKFIQQCKKFVKFCFYNWNKTKKIIDTRILWMVKVECDSNTLLHTYVALSRKSKIKR